MFAKQAGSQDLGGNVAAESVLFVQLQRYFGLIGCRVERDVLHAADQYARCFDGGFHFQPADVGEVGIDGVGLPAAAAEIAAAGNAEG